MPHFDWTQWGIAGAVIAVLFFILWRILIWVMKWVDKQAEQHAAERKIWQETQVKTNATLDRICSNIERHDEKAEERGKYVRAEHEKMIENLEEQGKVLLRINGYKHE